jgi:transcriptional regulator with XRE-family HTH domain
MRNQQGWSQAELAAKLQIKGWDCTRSWLAKIEARQVAVKDFELLYFRAVFGNALEDFYSTLVASKADPRNRGAGRGEAAASRAKS